jgi:hypothetical protein
MIRDAKAHPDGLRIPAADLERIVIESVAANLKDARWVTASFAKGVTGSMTGKLIAHAASLAARIEKQAIANDGALRTIISRVEVSPQAIRILIMKSMFDTLLDPETKETQFPAHKNDHIDIIVSGQFLRCGKQVRLVLGNDDPEQSKPDERLIQELVRARRWFDDLAVGRAASLAELARRSQLNVAHVSRRITLAFLAPDIVERIVAGTQPIGLTPERLGKACPLPISWDEQHAILLA